MHVVLAADYFPVMKPLLFVPQKTDTRGVTSTTHLLPPLPPSPAPGLLIIFSAAQWSVLLKRQQFMYDASERILEKLGTFTSMLEKIMTQEDQLTEAVAANTAAVQAITDGLPVLSDAITAEIAAVAHLTELLSAGPEPSEAVAQAISDLGNSTTSLQTAHASLAGSADALAADDVIPE